mgnify:CR=1 FL=1
MGKSNFTPVVLGLLIAFSSISGCLGNDLFETADKKGKPGGLALACLSSAKYTSMVVEIDYDPGYMPEQSSIDLLKTRLQEVCDKPNGIEVTLTETDFGQSGSWTADDFREKAWMHKSADPMTGSTIYKSLLTVDKDLIIRINGVIRDITDNQKAGIPHYIDRKNGQIIEVDFSDLIASEQSKNNQYKTHH